MATFTVNLSPGTVMEGADGSLDGSVLAGVSQQRSAASIMVKNGTDRKIAGAKDGVSFTDTIATTADLSFIVAS